MLVLPGEVVGDMDGVSTDGNDGQNVGTERITDHDKLLRIDVGALQDALIGMRCFLADDVDLTEVIGQS